MVEVSAKWIIGTLVTLLVAAYGVMVRRFAKNWETRLVAQSKKLDYHGAKIAEHENKHARQDERNTNVDKALNRIEEGIQGVNNRLDNVIGTGRASS